MGKGMWQRAYDFFDKISTPKWLKDFLKSIQDLLLAAFLQIGKDYLMGLQTKIIEVNGLNISSEEKFKKVFDWGKKNIPDIKDSLLNMAIEIIYNKIKVK